jgi:tRNA threonylcarbamoyladenosine biosynthesis protein TsaE
MKIVTENTEETQKVGEFLAKEIRVSKNNQKGALVIGLEGDLGGGKTTFVQGLAKGLGIKDKITSPTFVILKKYDIKRRTQDIKCLYHLDCYRIGPKDLSDLDFKEIIKNPQNVIVIEWVERIKKNLPANAFWIKFKYLDKNKRELLIK